MAVYTEVGDEALSAFLAGYDLGRVSSFKGIAEGVENSNFLLITTEGPFILTLYEKRVHEGDLPFFIGLMEHLALRGVNCPQPVRARNGEALGRLAGRSAAIVTFLDGLWLRRPRAQHCGQVGEALARMHERAPISRIAGPTRSRSAAGRRSTPPPSPELTRSRPASPAKRRRRSTRCAGSGRRICRAASSMPISSPTMSSFLASAFPA